jgi:ribA/ribD-fused uncharacterized protein
MADITHFHGDYFFLSNFYPSQIEWEGELYPTVEHAFQAAKTFDLDERGAVQYATTAAGAKQIGRQVNLRADWELVKLDVMRELVRKKFRDPELRAKLVATGEAKLIEGNTWNDKTWGCVMFRGEWIGKNCWGRC